MKTKLIYFFFALLFIGCAPKAAEEAPMSSDQQLQDNSGVDSRKLIKEAVFKFRTDDNQETYTLIKNSLKSFGAYISKESEFNYTSETGKDLTLRVPADKFDSYLNYISSNVKIKEIDYKSTHINDVTEDFIDVEARLKIKKETELKLTELLKQAKNLSETLEIQKQLTDLRADIESVEGRLKYLNDQVSYSTINITFYENVKYSERFFSDIWDALRDGWQVFLHVVTLLSYLWVVILVFFVIRWGYKYYRKYKKKINS